MIQIVKITRNDDSVMSQVVEVMVCSSIPEALNLVLADVNKEFDGQWKSLGEAAGELEKEIDYAWTNGKSWFEWCDNGKGIHYLVARINERKVNAGFQMVGSLQG